MSTHNWQTFFDAYAPRYMGEVFVKATLAEVDFMIEHLHLQPGMRLLDIGCGTGRHAIELARRGYRMTGVDLSQGMLAEAQRTAQAAGVSIEWVHCPAQAYTSPPVFDAVYSVCEGALCLLGLDDAFDRDAHVLANMFAALKPGGYALVTVLNGMRSLRTASEADVQAGRFDPLNLVECGEMEVETPSGIIRVPTRERGYVPSELRLLLQHAGFSVERISGGTAGNWRTEAPLLDEMELLALARRPAKE
ncbi:MAG TPA: methyltransferase domain-containing protein [Anaerolineaceae bacterium]